MAIVAGALAFSTEVPRLAAFEADAAGPTWCGLAAVLCLFAFVLLYQLLRVPAELSHSCLAASHITCCCPALYCCY